MIKTSQYYYIDYQYFLTDIGIEEQLSDDDDDFGGDSKNRNLKKRHLELDYGPYLPVYPGRINRIKFKLCHEYCETCYELDESKENHKCKSCLPEYQYNYLFFSNRAEENPETCVPEGYYYDTNDNKLYLCSSTDNYYINITDNKKICFKHDDDNNNCPPSYPIYDTTTKECYSCDVEHFKKGVCDYNDFDTTNEDFFERIKNGGFISNFKSEDGYLRVNNGNGYAFEITNVQNELNSLKDNIQNDMSIIDFKDCADLLRSQNGLESNDDLVILKYEKENSNGKDMSIQYEVYLSNSTTKLNLSVCENTDITIYIPIELDEKTQKLYDSLKAQGYNLFDRNDKFYRDICTPYKSLDGTDVVLLDRVNYIYEQNKLTCQNNCEFSEYLPDSKYLKCDCKVTNEEKIETKDPEKITAKSVGKSFFNVLKYSNYKVLRCYNLVFRKVTIKENVGSILSNIYFIGYLIAFGIFCYKKGEYLKIEIEKLLGNEDSIDKNSIELNKDKISIFQKNSNNDKDNLQNDIKATEKFQDNNGMNILKINKTKTEANNNILKGNKRKNGTDKKDKNIDSNAVENNHSKNRKDIDSLKDILSENRNMGSKIELANKVSIVELKSEKEKTPSEKKSKKSEKEEESLTDYELNDLEYDEALELDNRNFLKIYWYLLKREHIIIFTFFNWNDYNLFSIKLSKLFLSICSDMAFNVFFFSDESMHNIYVSGGENDFIGQLAQMVYSTIVSQILQIFINYLTMTDIHYYELKELKKENKINNKEGISVIKCIKHKLIAYHISTFILFLFFWYTASAFCAVYANTQRIFVTDSYTSFLMGLVYPFALYLAPTALRFISLKAKKNKNLKFLYSLSDKVPFF